MNQKFVSKQLEQLGFEVFIAENGKDALGLFERNDFNIILMDCMMPVLDGLKATQAIRKIENEKNLPRVPVVGVTALGFSRIESECLAAGMDTCLMKPVKFGELRHVIETFLGSQLATQANQHQQQKQKQQQQQHQQQQQQQHQQQQQQQQEQDQKKHSLQFQTTSQPQPKGTTEQEKEDGFHSPENSDTEEH